MSSDLLHNIVCNVCNVSVSNNINPLNAELSPICHLLALLGAHHIFHVSGLSVKRDTVNDVHRSSCK